MAANRPRHPDSAKSDATPSTSSSSSSTCRVRPARAAARNRAGYDNEVDVIDCSRGCCKSCVAGAIADGVAICCCPCAVVDLAAFVLVRVPWMVGRRCLAMARGKRKRKRIGECGGGGVSGGGRGGNPRQPRRRSGGMSLNYLERWSVNDGMIEVTTSFKDDEEEPDERVWLELCRGFGRLSFTGKGN
uniref:Uncharacterized protein n=1 Tax=Kalanchoe fedtschenkoi TaxID=63787 RepID=A0A7N0UPR3_KALFE